MKRFLAVQVLPASAALACVLMSNQSSTRLAAQAAVAQAAVAQTVSTNGMVLCQATEIDLSSPEKSVRAFVAAMNAGRFEEAALCVDGASPKADFKPLRELMSGGKQNIPLEKPIVSLSALTSSTKGDKATIKAKVTVKIGANQQNQIESISLVRRGARWLIVPLNPQAPPKNAGYLASSVAIIRSPQLIADVMSRARERALRASCSSNLKQIALAALMLMQDHDEKIAMTPQNFKAKLFPYAKTMQIFRCPSVKSGESYSFNGNLANRSLSEISNPSQVVMFYEGKNGQLDFRHLGTANVAFVDGHVKQTSRSEAKTLKWKP